MSKLSVGQLGRASEIAGNVAVAWFSAGAISPLLARPSSLGEFVFTFFVAIFMAGVFFIVSLKFVENIKS
jgi:hypothetical protein